MRELGGERRAAPSSHSLLHPLLPSLPPPPLHSHPPAAAAAATSKPPDASTFRPGWEDIFRMNQKQLEAAIHRVSNDDSLEPTRKAYLIQNIMVGYEDESKLKKGMAEVRAG
jgi:hypothetical protein